MNPFILSLAFSFAFIGVAAAAETTTENKEVRSFNRLCPVCEKPVSAETKTITFKPSPEAKAQQAAANSEVGFCSTYCRGEYEKSPAKYEKILAPEYNSWQEAKNTKVK